MFLPCEYNSLGQCMIHPEEKQEKKKVCSCCQIFDEVKDGKCFTCGNRLCFCDKICPDCLKLKPDHTPYCPEVQK